MMLRTIRSDPPSGPIHGCPKRVYCELASLSDEDWAVATLVKRIKNFQRCTAKGHCPLSGLPCDDRPAASQIDPATGQAAKLTDHRAWCTKYRSTS